MCPRLPGSPAPATAGALTAITRQTLRQARARGLRTHGLPGCRPQKCVPTVRFLPPRRSVSFPSSLCNFRAQPLYFPQFAHDAVYALQTALYQSFSTFLNSPQLYCHCSVCGGTHPARGRPASLLILPRVCRRASTRPAARCMHPGTRFAVLFSPVRSRKASCRPGPCMGRICRFSGWAGAMVPSVRRGSSVPCWRLFPPWTSCSPTGFIFALPPSLPVVGLAGLTTPTVSFPAFTTSHSPAIPGRFPSTPKPLCACGRSWHVAPVPFLMPRRSCGPPLL